MICSSWSRLQAFSLLSCLNHLVLFLPTISVIYYSICDLVFQTYIPKCYLWSLVILFQALFTDNYYRPQVVLSNILLAWPYFTANGHLAFHTSVALMLYKSLLHGLSVGSLNFIQAVLYESTSLVWHRRHCTTCLQNNGAVQCTRGYSSHCQWSGKDILIFLPFKL